MKEINFKKHLEVATNIAVLLVAVVVLITFAWKFLAGSPKPKLQSGLQKGVAFKQLSGIPYGDSPQTLFIAMSTKCHYCDESVPFYKHLVEIQRGNSTTRLIALFPNTQSEVNQYVKDRQLDLNTIAAVDFNALNVSGTPTMILIDRNGKILDFWVGKLLEGDQLQVVKAVSMLKS